jgi:hypothetical protein
MLFAALFVSSDSDLCYILCSLFDVLGIYTHFSITNINLFLLHTSSSHRMPNKISNRSIGVEVRLPLPQLYRNYGNITRKIASSRDSYLSSPTLGQHAGPDCNSGEFFYHP